MLGDISGLERIYIVCGYTDMRKSIDVYGEDGLLAILLYGYTPTSVGSNKSGVWKVTESGK